jgi:hypothetical protein
METAIMLRDEPDGGGCTIIADEDGYRLVVQYDSRPQAEVMLATCLRLWRTRRLTEPLPSGGAL